MNATTSDPMDLRPLQALRDPGSACFDCYSALSAMVAALDREGNVVYGNAAFVAEVGDWRAESDPPHALADVWPAVAAALPEFPSLAVDAAPLARVREVVLAPETAAPREHLAYLDPLLAPESGALCGWALTLVDIADIRRSERSSRDSLEIERFLSRLSSRFIGTTDIRENLAASLQDIGELTGASRVFYGAWDPSSPGIDDMVFWQKSGVVDLQGAMDHHRTELRAWYEEIFVDQEALELEDLPSQLPPRIRELATGSGDDLAGGLLFVPLVLDARLSGVIGVRYRQPDTATRASAWIALDIFCHILERVLQLRRSEEVLRATNRELHDTSAQLMQSEKMASIGQMAAGVAHEINNPIGFVMSNLATLRDYAGQVKTALAVCRQLAPDSDALPPAATEALSNVDRDDLAFLQEDLDDLLAESLEGCERVRDIVQNLKGFARSDDHTLRAADLADCVESTLKIVWNELKYRCDVVTDFGDVPPVVCLPGKINQVIMNLLLNAAHAIDEQGTVTVSTAVDGDEAVLRVTDTGRGVPADVLPRLFDPFFTTKEPGKGTGLGLYICHGIVEEHGGTITVDSPPGEGTTVSVRLPLSGLAGDGEDAHV